MATYLILFRPEDGIAATPRVLLSDLSDYQVRLRGSCACVAQIGATTKSGQLVAISSPNAAFEDLEARIGELVHNDDDHKQHHIGKSWYKNIYAWCDDEQPDNTLFVGVAKDLVSARVRGK